MHLRSEPSGTWGHRPSARHSTPLRLAAALAVLLTGFLVSGTSAWGAGNGPPATWIIHGRSPSTKTVKGVTTSHNWSGYAVTGTTFTQVAGQWTQPTAQCPTPTKKTEAAAFWVGIDGFSSKDDTVEQIGTDSDCDKGSKKGPGIPNYYAWWEMDTATSTGSTTIADTVSPGDQMSAVVTNSGGSYTLTLVDEGKWSYSAGPFTPSPAPKAASAEWIAEAPSICTAKKCTPENLADFSSVTFGGATANGDSVSSFPNNQTFKIDMKKGKTLKAEPVALSGSQFTIDWEHS